MSQPKRGLGKGLGALLGDAPVPTSPEAHGVLREIPVARITPNPFQPRKHFDAGAMDDAAGLDRRVRRARTDYRAQTR